MKKIALLTSLFILALGFNLKAQAPAPATQSVQSPNVLPSAAAIPPAGVNAPPPDISMQTQAPQPQSPEMTDPLLEGFFEDIQYNPTDRRDPFLPYLSPAMKMTQAPSTPLEPLQKFALTELKLIGIIWDVGTPKALIVDPAGKSYIIAENTKMGSGLGYVAAIREGEIIVVEPQMSAEGKKSFETKVLKLSSIKGTP